MLKIAIFVMNLAACHDHDARMEGFILPEHHPNKTLKLSNVKEHFEWYLVDYNSKVYRFPDTLLPVPKDHKLKSGGLLYKGGTISPRIVIKGLKTSAPVLQLLQGK